MQSADLLEMQRVLLHVIFCHVIIEHITKTPVGKLLAEITNMACLV